MNIKFVHTNLIAYDWEKLVTFYMKVFNCEPVYPERDMKGNWIEELTRIPDVHIKGIHLKLPGYKDGPTLEIFSYNKTYDRENPPEINAPGFAHIAFHTDQVEELLQRLIDHGGEKYGEMVEKEIEGVGVLKVIYAKDPEGNIIEIQKWNKIK